MHRRLFLAGVISPLLARSQSISGKGGVSGGIGINGSIAVVSPPVALGFTPSFTVTRTGAGNYATSFNIQSVKPAFTTTIFVGSGGSNAANGLTHANRVRSLKQAVTLANSTGGSVRIFADPGQYLFSNQDGGGIPDSFGGALPGCPTLTIEVNGTGQAISTHNQIMPGYVVTSDANIYVSTYTTEIPNPCCWDAAHLNPKGRPQALRNVGQSLDGNVTAILAAINTRWALYSTANQGQPMGASYLDVTNKKLYVRLSDNRAPDANLFTGRGSAAGNSNAYNILLSPPFGTNQIVWASNIDFWGGSTVQTFVNFPDSAPTLTAYFNSCAGMYSIFDGMHFDGAGLTYFVNHICMDSLQDGYNYTSSSPGGGQQRWNEFGCYSGWCGNDDDSFDTSKNGSSAHGNTRGVRINGVYEYAQNRIVHDIESCVSWNLGCASTNCRQTGAQSASFVSGYLPNTGETSIVYLDGCVSSGVSFNLGAYKGGSLLTRNMNTAGFTNENTGGTIGTY